jgi:AraC-like DNA-binding protein
MVKYAPTGHGKEKGNERVRFLEAEPPKHLQGIVHRFIHLSTDGVLPHDYKFHALPDACSYLVFDQLQPGVAGATRLRLVSEEFNLGKFFHFINIRLLPGVWQLHRHDLAIGQIRTIYTGELPFIKYSQLLKGQDFESQQLILVDFVESLISSGVIATNAVLYRVLMHLDEIRSVSDMAAAVGVSSRHLQRLINNCMGFSPHDLLKVLKLQLSLKGDTSGLYSDQSHFINSFKKATGYTPTTYSRAFDV